VPKDRPGGERPRLKTKAADLPGARPHLARVRAVGLGIAVAQRRTAPRFGPQALAGFDFLPGGCFGKKRVRELSAGYGRVMPDMIERHGEAEHGPTQPAGKLDMADPKTLIAHRLCERQFPHRLALQRDEFGFDVPGSRHQHVLRVVCHFSLIGSLAKKFKLCSQK